MESARILVVEDDVLLGEELRVRLTRHGWAVSGPVRSGSEALASVRVSVPDLVLMDIHLAGAVDGIETAGSLRRSFDVPILFLTAHADDATVERAKGAGPIGFLAKPISEQHLKNAVSIALHHHRLERREKQTWACRELVLSELAMRDPLTGIWNRRRIVEILGDEVARAAREHRAFAVMMIDVDRFKAVNDTHGHLAGDAVLCEVVSRIKGEIRCYDSLGRFGGDELLLVCADSWGSDALELAVRLRGAVARAPVVVDHHQVSVGIGVGVCTSLAAERLSVNALVAAADRALYEGKRARDHDPTVAGARDPLVLRVQAEFREMPGLTLTAEQARRLWTLDAATCEAVLERLLDAKFLTRTRTGAFARSVE